MAHKYSTVRLTGIDLAATEAAIDAFLIANEVVLKHKHINQAGTEALIFFYGQYPFDNGKVVISFDDIEDNQFSIAYPILQAQGIAATFYVVTDWFGDPNKMTWANIIAMNVGGMDIQCHSNTHPDFTTLTALQITQQLTDVNNAFIANGLPVPQHLAYPMGAYNANVKLWVSALRQTARTVGAAGSISIGANYDKYELMAVNIDKQSLSNDLDVILNDLVLCKRNRYARIIYLHGVTVNGGVYSASVSDFNTIIDYAQGLGIDIITMSQLYALMI